MSVVIHNGVTVELPSIIAVDFDGTLVEDKFPLIGSPNPVLIDYLKQQKSIGAKLILWTCRNGTALDNAVQFCRFLGLEFDAVNENLPEVKTLFGGDTRKVYADIYLDDKFTLFVKEFKPLEEYAMGFESNFQSAALEYLNSLPRCRAENVSGNAGQSGRPDIVGCYKGRMFKFELKVADHKNVASTKQQLNLRRWKNSGCVVGVIYSMKELRRIFNLDWDMPQLKGKRVEKEELNGCLSWTEFPDLEV